MSSTVAILLGGLLGSAIAAGANFLFRWLEDHRRWKREDQVSLRRDQLKLYRQVIVSLEATQNGHFPHGEQPYAFSEALMPVLAEMKLISSDQVANDAQRAVSTAQYHEHLSIKNEYGEKVDNAATQLDRRTEEFIESVRVELGLPTEEEPKVVTTRRTEDSNS